MYNKINVSRKTKTSYNLKRMEYIVHGKILQFDFKGSTENVLPPRKNLQFKRLNVILKRIQHQLKIKYGPRSAYLIFGLFDLFF